MKCGACRQSYFSWRVAPYTTCAKCGAHLKATNYHFVTVPFIIFVAALKLGIYRSMGGFGIFAALPVFVTVGVLLVNQFVEYKISKNPHN